MRCLVFSGPLLVCCYDMNGKINAINNGDKDYNRGLSSLPLVCSYDMNGDKIYGLFL